MKPARVVLLLVVCLIGGMLVLSAAPASSQGAKSEASGVHSFVQKHRSEAFWRKAMKTAKPKALPRATRGLALHGPAQDETGAPVVIPPTGSEGTDETKLPEIVSAPGPRAQGGFPAIPFTRTEITDPSQSPFHRHGKIFFTQAGQTYVCSGTIVTAENESVVATAGHCVFDEALDVANSSTMFVPGYRNGNRPFGIWDGVEVHTTQQWRNGDIRYDVGMVVMETQNGQTIQDIHGSRGIAFNQSQTQLFDSFGYPASEPFDGERLYRCDSSAGYTDPQHSTVPPHAIGCDMNQGSSGGGWTINTGAGEVVNSVNSYLYPSVPGLIFGPYFGTVAEAVYNVASDNEGGPTPTATPTDTDPVSHASSLTLQLKKHLKAKGLMSPLDGFAPCSQQAPVGIYKLIDATTGRLVGKIHNSALSGLYGFRIPDKKGKYFANVFARDLDPLNLCEQAQSGLVRHRH